MTPEARIVVVACKVLEAALQRILPITAPELADRVSYLDYGLHRVPVKLTDAVQEALQSIEQPSFVILGYGLCGNGMRGIRSGQHTIITPRTDDCIALLLGSYKAYMREFSKSPGTYYLTKGWLESGSHPLKEYYEYLPKYGHDTTMWLLDQQYANYERIALVASNSEELAAYREQAQEVARFCQRWNYRYEEITGSDDYVLRLIELAGAVAGGAVHPQDVGQDFLVIPPGEEIRQEMYMR